MMKIRSIQRSTRKHAALIGLALLLVFCLEYLGAFVGLGNFFYDAFFRLRGVKPVDSAIVIVAVDEISLKNLGQWPIARRHWARLLDRLHAAKAVGFDILMTEPSGDDPLLAQAVRRHGRVVFPVYLTQDARWMEVPPVLEPQGIGHIHLEQDIDGVVRSVYHTLYRDGRALPSFSSRLYELDAGRSLARQNPGAFPNDRPSILQRDFFRINFYGPPGSFATVALIDVLSGKYPPDFFKNKIVLVGVTATGLEAGVITPFSERRNYMTGVETHAHILNNLRHGRGVFAVAALPVWALALVFSGLMFLVMLHIQDWRVMAVWIFAVLCAVTFSFVLFAGTDVWFNPAPFTILLFLAFFFAYVIRMEAQTRMLAAAGDLWRDTFDSIDEAIWVTDREGKMLKSNQTANHLWSDDTLRNILSSGVFAKIPSLSGGPSGTGSDTTSSGGKLTDEMVDDASDRHFTIKVIPRRADGLTASGFVVCVRDVTQERRAERERQNLEAKLIQAQKMEAIGTLAGGIAHDFNNILMGVQGYVSLLMMEYAREDPRFLKLKKIEEQVQSAARLTRQLLGFARGGKYEVKPVDVNAIVKNSAEVFGRTKKQIGISIRCQEDIWPVMGDAGQIEQVLLNMYINSWQAMPNGGDLFLATRNVHLGAPEAGGRGIRPGAYVKISVTDTGIGMDENTQRRVFEPFFTTKEPGRGTGLGLASAYGIVARHDGLIDVESEPGKGSTFHIYLPAAEVAQPERGPEIEKELQRGKETILVVDDEPMNTTVMKEILESLGYRVLCAGSGQEALSIYMIKHKDIDLVILDMIMPGMGGGAAFDAMREINPGVKVILSSGYNLDGETRRILDRGCVGFLQKPFLIHELADKIRDCL
jgi:CHASE2 domain-containing sensor protein/nitrogen-specific signal transduction histidine kinase/CheY-like chemotaxis protein